MAHFGHPDAEACSGMASDLEDEEDEYSSRAYGIKRSYIVRQDSPPSSFENGPQAPGGAKRTTGAASSSSSRPEAIQVILDEGYFASERRALKNVLANASQRLKSVQMFNPAKNQLMKRQQEHWNQNEKYTLDSLNVAPRGLACDQWAAGAKEADGQRQLWSSKLQYFLAITSYSIGLGNVIRFPIMVQKNGGLAFIIPFIVMLIVEGVPLFYLELAVGQRMRRGAISGWNLVSPFAVGIGVASGAVSFLVGLYYNTVVAWTLLYLWGASTSSQLPFSECPVTIHPSSSSGQFNISDPPRPVASRAAATSSAASSCQLAGSYRHYWYTETLNASQGVHQWTNFNWPMVLALMVAWAISYLCLFRGLFSSKRMVYVASTFPYVILGIFFFKAISLDGMSDGLYYLFSPNWSKLADPYVWLQAAGQVFFSLGLGFGGLIALSSYNPVNNNCYKDAIKVSLVNFCTSIFAGVVIFAILGYKARLSVDRCNVERERAIEFYLSDYNMKVLDYGAVFKPLNSVGVSGTSTSTSNEREQELPKLNLTLKELQGLATEDYYDTSEALASIRSLDRQLDVVSEQRAGYDYGDADTEFIIDTSNIISRNDLNKIIDSIPGLPTCSLERDLDDASQGSGLMFVVMAEAISQFDEPRTWAILFFLMLLTLGLDSQFGNLEGLLSSMADLNHGQSQASPMKRQLMTGLICCLSLVISVLMFAHGAGSYMLAIFDEYATSFSLIIIALFELLAISYIYGLKRFCDDCELMTGQRPPFIILLSWRYISPILLLTVLVASVRDFSHNLSYQIWLGDHLDTSTWPDWCIAFAVFLILACVLWIPLVFVLRLVFKISFVKEEKLAQSHFPEDELRDFHDIQEEHKVTKLERVLFGFRSDDD